jgi:hypothetical protein
LVDGLAPLPGLIDGLAFLIPRQQDDGDLLPDLRLVSVPGRVQSRAKYGLDKDDIVEHRYQTVGNVQVENFLEMRLWSYCQYTLYMEAISISYIKYYVQLETYIPNYLGLFLIYLLVHFAAEKNIYTIL